MYIVCVCVCVCYVCVSVCLSVLCIQSKDTRLPKLTHSAERVGRYSDQLWLDDRGTAVRLAAGAVAFSLCKVCRLTGSNVSQLSPIGVCRRTGNIINTDCRCFLVRVLKGAELTGEKRKVHSEELHHMYSPDFVVWCSTGAALGRVCTKHARDAYGIYVGTLKERDG